MTKKHLSILGFAEKGFSIFTLLFSTTPIIQLFRVVSGTEEDFLLGDPLTQAIWFGLYLVNLFFVILRWRRFVYTAQQNKLILLISGLALFSVLWSTDPLITLRRSVALILTNIFGVYLASRYSLREQLGLLTWAFGIAIILSLVFIIVPPHYGIETKVVYAGGWRGIYYHKNVLGRIMSLSAVAFLLLALEKDRYKLVKCISCALSFLLLLLSTSKTSLIVFLIVAFFFFVYKNLPQHYSLKIPFLIALVLISAIVGTLLVSNLEAVLSLLGKNITLTGRTGLWLILFEIGKDQPWLGFGYGGFWLGWDGPSSLVRNALITWLPNHAHNGFLQLWLDLGLVGLSLFIFSFITTFKQAMLRVRSSKTVSDFWSLLFLTFMLINNLSECVILSPNSLFWILYVTIAYSMTMQSERERKISYVSTSTNKHGWVQDA